MRSKRARGRLQTAFGPSWAANLPSKTANMAAKTANLAAKTPQLAHQSRSERVLERPRNEADRLKPPKTAPTVIFEGSWVDFSLIFARRWHDFRFMFVRLWSPGAVVRTHLQCVPRTALIAQDANNNCLPDTTDAPRVDAPRVYTACVYTASCHTITPSIYIYIYIYICVVGGTWRGYTPGNQSGVPGPGPNWGARATSDVHSCNLDVLGLNLEVLGLNLDVLGLNLDALASIWTCWVL